jgi:hypothetical protein
MGDLLQTLYLRSRDHYEGALRWSAILLGFVVLLHLMVLTELARCKHDIFQGGLELRRLQTAVSHSQSLRTNLTVFQETTLSGVTNLMNGFDTSLRSDFTNLYLASIHAKSNGVYPDDRLSTPQTGRTSVSELTRQMPPAVAPMTTPISWSRLVPNSEYGLLRQVSGAPEQAEGVLLPMIKRLILAQRFTEANHSWAQTVVATKELAAKLDLETQALGKVLLATNEVLALQAIQQAVRSVVKTSESHQFRMPEDDTWWRSIAGKEGFRDSQITALSTQVSSVTNARSLAISLETNFVSAYQMREEVNRIVQARQETLEKSLQHSQEHLGKLAKPLQLVALDADVLLSRLPLLVGLVLGIALSWTAYHARALQRAAAGLPEKNLIESNHEVLSPGPLPLWGLGLSAVLSILWLGAAYWTATLALGARLEIFLSALAGLVVVCSSLWYRHRVT